MDNVKNLIERSKDFEQAHKCCQELLEDDLIKIEAYVTKWIPIALGIILLFIIAAFSCIYAYFQTEISTVKSDIAAVRTKVDHRYFQVEETLEDIHKVKIENGHVIQDFRNTPTTK